jgi:hypothetical protein
MYLIQIKKNPSSSILFFGGPSTALTVTSSTFKVVYYAINFSKDCLSVENSSFFMRTYSKVEPNREVW